MAGSGNYISPGFTSPVRSASSSLLQCLPRSTNTDPRMKIVFVSVLSLACVLGLALATGYSSYGYGSGYGQAIPVAMPHYGGSGYGGSGGLGNGGFLALIGLLFILAIIFPSLSNQGNSNIILVNGTSG